MPGGEKEAHEAPRAAAMCPPTNEKMPGGARLPAPTAEFNHRGGRLATANSMARALLGAAFALVSPPCDSTV